MAVAKPKTEPVETPEEEPAKSATIDDVKRIVQEAIASVLGKTGEDPDEPVPEKEGTDPEEIETPRQQESRMRQAVESALPALHIHMNEAAERETKKEPEVTPGKPNLLQKIIGL
jgi:hypothetical protein